jgi:peptidoglycan/xylan/chitin deacetylase (PgdA/CDA1 family)
MPSLALMYHEFSDDLQGVVPEHRPYVLAPAKFEHQLTSIAHSDLQVVTVVTWCSKPDLLRGLVMTFDDGHVSNHQIVLPLLIRFGLTATFFITVGRIGSGDTMGWSQIRELHSAGMEIGSHTMTHRPPSTLNNKELRYELVESRRILEDGLGGPITSISCPTGFYDARMREIAAEAGYRSLCIGRVGLISELTDPYSLNRIAIKSSLDTKSFEELLRFDHSTIRRLRFQQSVREKARTSFGPKAYLRFRQIIMRSAVLMKAVRSREKTKC